MNATAYVRVSTDTQDVANQRHELETYAREIGVEITAWIEAEDVSSRKSYKARQIDEVLKLRKGATLLVTEFSRIARSVKEVLHVVEALGDKGVTTHISKLRLRLNGKNDISTTAIVTSMGLAAQIERELISSRTREALARRRAEGKLLGMAGRPVEFVKATQAKGAEANRQKAAERAGNAEELLRSFKARGLTERQMAQELNRIGMPSPRGGNWSQATVNRMCNRIGLHAA